MLTLAGRFRRQRQCPFGCIQVGDLFYHRTHTHTHTHTYAFLCCSFACTHTHTHTHIPFFFPPFPPRLTLSFIHSFIHLFSRILVIFLKKNNLFFISHSAAVNGVLLPWLQRGVKETTSNSKLEFIKLEPYGELTRKEALFWSHIIPFDEIREEE